MTAQINIEQTNTDTPLPANGSLIDEDKIVYYPFDTPPWPHVVLLHWTRVKPTSKLQRIEPSTELSRVSKIVDKLMNDNEIFNKLDKDKFMEFWATLMSEMPSVQLTSISEDELTRRIDKVMAIEAMSGMLNDLTPEQIKSFDAAVKRRKFFR